MRSFHILSIFHCFLIFQCTQKRRFHQAGKNLEKIQEIQWHLLATDLLNTDQHYELSVFPDSRHIHRIIFQEFPVCPHISIFQFFHCSWILTQFYRIRIISLHLCGCCLQTSITIFPIQCVKSKGFIFQNIFQNTDRFNIQFLRLDHIQFSCNVKNLSKAVFTSKYLFFIQVRYGFLIHFTGKKKFLLKQIIFFFNKLYIILIFHSDITTDRSNCKIKDKWNPVWRFIEQYIPAASFCFKCTDKW